MGHLIWPSMGPKGSTSWPEVEYNEFNRINFTDGKIAKKSTYKTEKHMIPYAYIYVSTLPPKSLPIPISVYVIKHACYSELGEGQGVGQQLCKLGKFLTKL